MLDIKRIRDDKDAVRTGVARKGTDPELIDRVYELDTEVRSLKTEIDNLRQIQNKKSRTLGRIIATHGKLLDGAPVPPEAMRKALDAFSPRTYESATEEELCEAIQEVGAGADAELSNIKARIARFEERMRECGEELLKIMDSLPNVPRPEVPDGKSEADNKLVKEWGEKPTLEKPKPHWDIGPKFGFAQERGAKMSGSGFLLSIGPMARLERALITLFLETNTIKKGYTEVNCPYLVRDTALYGTGQLPKFGAELYYAERDDLYLIPTAETPLTNIHAGEILAESDLPKRYTAFTPCWRREAGAAGADTRGMIRVHQFSKVEVVEFQHPDKSYDALEALTRNAEELLEALELPYRRVLVCTGEMGFSNSMQYDLEVWAAGVERWLEVSSCSNFESFQARRCRIRYKDSETGKNEFVHTLNGSALALPRVIIALLENGRQTDGSVKLPKAIHHYYGKETL